MTAGLIACQPLFAEHCTWTPLWMPHTLPAKWYLLLTHLTDETTEAQRGMSFAQGRATCKERNCDLNLDLSDPRA